MAGGGPWWRRSALYQVYLRSFQDSNGDGVGDLEGLRRRLPWLAETLRVDALWLSPVHPSPDADFGYDVADYRGVHPNFGTEADLQRVIDEAHGLGLKIILDGVFNHTSRRHPWFEASQRDPVGPYSDWYIWRDGRTPGPRGKPPNNWQSAFGGGAWTWSPVRKQWYLHSFSPQQPDLNLRHPDVVQAVLDVMDHWFQRGVDGLRLDVFNCYRKDPELRDNPRRWNPAGLAYGYLGQHHVHDRDQDDLGELLGQMRAVADRHGDRVLIGETLDERFIYDNAERWVGTDRLHLAFHFGLLHARWGAKHFAEAIRGWTEALGSHRWPTWVVSNHDFPRAYSRWGGRGDRARLLALILTTLRGTPVLYYGDEIGMGQARLPLSGIKDRAGRRYWPFYPGRDGARTPMQWSGGPQAGFSTSAPWLPVQADHATCNVAVQSMDPSSVLRAWQELLELRRAHAALHSGAMEGPHADHPRLLSWIRSHGDERLAVVVNMGDRVERWSPAAGARWRRVWSTHRKAGAAPVDATVVLQPTEGLLLLAEA